MTIEHMQNINKRNAIILIIVSLLTVLLIVISVDTLLIDNNSALINELEPDSKLKGYEYESAGSYLNLKNGNTTVILYTGFSFSIDFWAKVTHAVHKKAREMNIVIAEYSVDNCRQQIECIRNAIEAGIDGIIIGPICNEVIVAVNDAQKAKIPVITIDVPIMHSWVSTQIGTDNYAAGELAGKIMLKKIQHSESNDVRVIVITGDSAQSNASTRALGLTDVIGKAGINVTVRYSKDWSGTNALQNILEELSSDGQKAVGVFATFSPGTIAMVEGLEFMGVKAFTVGFDQNEVIKEMILTRRLDAAIIQNPALIGEKSVALMVDILNGKDVPKKVDVPALVLSQSNMHEGN